jgi:hypothetical protein
MKNILTGKVVMAALMLAGVGLCVSLIYILVARPAAPHPDPSAVAGQGSALTVIPAPTPTPLPPTPTLTPLPPTPTVSPTPGPGEIAVGAYVQITNTGQEGLNIRAEAGLTADVVFSGFDEEVFLVTGGPVEADGHTWWKLTASYDTTRTGWAAADYLTFIESP